MNSSSASSLCRIEWRRSRLLIAALPLLGLAAAAAVLLSALPRGLAIAAAILALAYAAVLALREARRQPQVLVCSGLHASATLSSFDAAGVPHPREVVLEHVQCRGPIAAVRVRDGARATRLLWWPDTLSAADRRALRLLLDARPSSSTLPRMAE